MRPTGWEAEAEQPANKFDNYKHSATWILFIGLLQPWSQFVRNWYKLEENILLNIYTGELIVIIKYIPVFLVDSYWIYELSLKLFLWTMNLTKMIKITTI